MHKEPLAAVYREYIGERDIQEQVHHRPMPGTYITE